MNKTIHIGKLIQAKMDADGRKAQWLANKLSCDRSNIYRIYQKQYIDIEQFIRICVILDIDLFTYCSEYVLEQIQNKKNDYSDIEKRSA